MQVIILGGTSLIARGWATTLRERGHMVYEYLRGSERRDGETISGPWQRLAENPHWPTTVDVIVNFVLLRDKGMDDNLAYCDQVIALCKRLQAKALVHLSSMSVYDAGQSRITEDSPIPASYADKPFYVGVKIATEQRLARESSGFHLVLLRTGLVLGPGIGNAIVGIAARLPGNLALVLGNPRQVIPLASRASVQQALTAAIEHPDPSTLSSLLVVDPQSPSRGEFVRACAQEVGQAHYVLSMGAWFWYPAAWLGEGLGRLLTRSSPGLYERVSRTFRRVTYDPSLTAQRLGVSLHIDWRKELRAAYDLQEPNYTAPALPQRGHDLVSMPSVLFIGFGPIVFQKHLPALKALGFKGRVDCYDPFRSDSRKPGFDVKVVTDPRESNASLVVVASPGNLHREAIDLLPASARVVLLEKPVGLSQRDFDAWRECERARGLHVLSAHNYRFKRNVRRMLDYLNRHNSGALRGCRVLCDSPSAGGAGAKWRREERASRALLLDGNLHYLDLVQQFAAGPCPGPRTSWQLDFHGRTCDIEGSAAFPNFPVYYQMRVGPGPDRTEVHFDFANYSVRLTFNPDTFTVLHGKTLLLHGLQESWQDALSLGRWAWCKLRHGDYDDSHHRVYREAAALLAGGSSSPLSLESLDSSYAFLFQIAEQVYGEATNRPSS